jgi:hypothetical protein
MASVATAPNHSSDDCSGTERMISTKNTKRRSVPKNGTPMIPLTKIYQRLFSFVDPVQQGPKTI